MTRHKDEVAEVTRWVEGIEKVHGRIARRFRRPEPRRRVLDYLRGLLSLVKRKNGWLLNQSQGGMCICRTAGIGLGISQERLGP